MPRALVSILILVLATSSVAVANPSLVYLLAQPEQGPSFSAADLQLIAEIPGGYLALLEPTDLARLQSWGLDHRVLTEDDPTTELLVQYDVPTGRRSTDLPTGAEVLHRGRGFTVLRLPAGSTATLMCLPDIQRVFRRPLRFVSRPWDGPRAGSPRTPSVEIQGMVDTVTESWLSNQVLSLQNFGTRHSSTTGGLQASQWLLSQFQSYGYTDVSLHDFDSNNDNVVCVKPGLVEPDKYVVIGGHFDSISSNINVAPGADDNATGTVAVLAAAQAMADYDFEYSVVFLCFSGEEQGLLGSEAWANEAANQGLDIVGAVVADMLGYRQAGDAADIDIITNGSSQPLRDLVDQAIADYVPGHVAVTGSLPFGASSDHASFWANGYRSVLFFEDTGDYSPYIHSSDDVMGLSVNDLGFMDRNVRTAIATLASLARPFDVAIAHQPLPDTEGLGPFTVSATILAARGSTPPASSCTTAPAARSPPWPWRRPANPVRTRP